MKKSVKRILSLFFAAALLVSALAFTSCGKSKTLKIGVPDDATNQARAIKILEAAGFIEVDPAAGYTPELKDITKYIYNIEIVPTTANTLTSTLDDYGASIINGTYATAVGLSPSKDALFVENQGVHGDNPYVNIISARIEDKDSELFKTIVDAFHTSTVAVYTKEKYKEAYIPAYAYDEIDVDPAKLVEEIDAYKSDKAGKTVVKVGVCGASNQHWNAVQKVLDEQSANIYLQLVEFDAYNLPNEALNNGDVDLNSFQHKAFMEKEISSQGYKIVSVGDSIIAPLSLYSNKAETLDALKDLAGLAE